ncbi:MAG: adenylate kinase [Chloroflexi bacterium]|nr:adenylate kinase [Chloroflexota bacterium]|tara:strand:+ start:5235 stop:5900 length:666 start_codon:yes stop_codon:yes gene_type:complete
MSKRMILLGPPGAGKGTQAVIMADNAGIAHVASGDLFRKHLGEGTELGLIAKGYMEKGDLVPDDLTVRMVLERIREDDASEGYVLDGFPRTVGQATALDQALLELGQSIDKAPLIEVGKQELIRRLSGRWVCRGCQAPYHEIFNPPQKVGICDKCSSDIYQREDDKPEVIAARLDTYEAQTIPLIEYYQSQGKLIRINGEQEVEAVTTDLGNAISFNGSFS